MRSVNAAAQNQRLLRKSIIEIPMIWLEATNRDTDEVEGIGFWRGEDVAVINTPDIFTGVVTPRTFYSGTIQSIDTIHYEQGLDVRSIEVTLVSTHAAVNQGLRYYEPKGATFQMWNRCYDPLTRNVLGIEDLYVGQVDDLRITRAEIGGQSSATLTLVPISSVLTVKSPEKRSDATQRKRTTPGGTVDRINRYKAIVNTWEVRWGQ